MSSLEEATQKYEKEAELIRQDHHDMDIMLKKYITKIESCQKVIKLQHEVKNIDFGPPWDIPVPFINSKVLDKRCSRV